MGADGPVFGAQVGYADGWSRVTGVGAQVGYLNPKP